MVTTALPLIYDLSFEDLEKIFIEWGEPRYRTKQVWQGLYQEFWCAPDEFSNLPIATRKKLNQIVSFSHLNPVVVKESADGETQKTLFSLQDGLSVEAVIMQYDRRRTICISSQAGCAMGCTFCATGQMGFKRHLSSGEIIEQVLYFSRTLKGRGEKITNIVVMGMGEPFHNYDAVLKAIERLGHPEGFHFGARRFTISTVGIIPGIKKFTAERKQINLAVSLHAADDKLRSSLLPVNQRYPIKELMAACQEYVEKTGRRVTFEWALIQGVNDSLEQAKKLALLLKNFHLEGAMLCHVNIIPLNPTQQFSGKATSHQQAILFKNVLQSNQIPCTIRVRRGIDISAGCGQLASESKN
jgi:23S rRNA (adenine2503-C2)-methyltransferase